MKEIKDIRAMLGVADEADIRDILKLELTADPHDIERVIKEKEAEMRIAARNLDFELAAILRDEIVVLSTELKQQKKSAKGGSASGGKTTPEKQKKNYGK